jgi:hypothetical protein
MNDQQKKVSIQTTGRNRVEIDDNQNSVVASTVGLRQLSLSDTAQANILTTASGQIITQQAAGTTVSDPTALTVSTAGPLTLAGAAVISTGGPDASAQTTGGVMDTQFQGLMSETMLGGWLVTIVGTLIFQAAAGLMTFSAPLVLLGTGSGGYKRLVNEEFFAAYLLHTHNVTAPGAPTGPPITGLPVVGTHTTINTGAS